MKQIKLTHNRYTLVDDEDFEYLNQWKWTFNQGYASRSGWPKGQVKMHRIVNNTPKGLETDHINRNKLDNRRSNLRTITHTQNQYNRSINKDNNSGIKGVHWNNKDKRYRAQIVVNNKQIYLGQFKDIGIAWLIRRWNERLYHRIDKENK